jgi:DNA-binding transcriptional MerR regulator
LTVLLSIVRRKWFEQLKNSRFQGVKELADAAEELLREMGSSQERGTVAEYPNERTVRYYLSEGLLPEPHGKAGSASIFGYEHLVTLVAIKKLQSQGLPINVIKGVIEGRSIDQLEGLLEDEEIGRSAPVAPPQAASFQPLDDVLFSSVEPPQAPKSPPPVNAAKSFLESLLFSRTSLEHKEEMQMPDNDDDYVALSRLPSAPLSAPDTEPRTWNRYEIEPGLELHVRDGYEPASGWRKVINAIEKILKMNKPGK